VFEGVLGHGGGLGTGFVGPLAAREHQEGVRVVLAEIAPVLDTRVDPVGEQSGNPSADQTGAVHHHVPRVRRAGARGDPGVDHVVHEVRGEHVTAPGTQQHHEGEYREHPGEPVGDGQGSHGSDDHGEHPRAHQQGEQVPEARAFLAQHDHTVGDEEADEHQHQQGGEQCEQQQCAAQDGPCRIVRVTDESQQDGDHGDAQKVRITGEAGIVTDREHEGDDEGDGKDEG
jgi:hypothetical protein